METPVVDGCVSDPMLDPLLALDPALSILDLCDGILDPPERWWWEEDALGIFLPRSERKKCLAQLILSLIAAILLPFQIWESIQGED